MSQEQLVKDAIAWIRQRTSNPEIAGMEISGSTHLFDQGVIDSLGLVDLVAYLDEKTGGQLDLLELDERQMSTLDGLSRAALASK